jgi:hypothetical protein
MPHGRLLFMGLLACILQSLRRTSRSWVLGPHYLWLLACCHAAMLPTEHLQRQHAVQ